MSERILADDVVVKPSVNLLCQVCGDPADVVWSGDKSIRCLKHLTVEVIEILEARESTARSSTPES